MINVNNSYLSFNLHFKIENLQSGDGGRAFKIPNINSYEDADNQPLAKNNSYNYLIALINNYICLICTTRYVND